MIKKVPNNLLVKNKSHKTLLSLIFVKDKLKLKWVNITIIFFIYEE